jgi:hypothetical protein
VYVYSGLLAAAAVALLVGAVGAYQAGTEPCPPGGGTCESYGVMVAFVLVGVAVVVSAAAGLGALLAAFLRRESRVAIWLTIALGGILSALGAIVGLGALAGDQAGTGVFLLGVAGALALPVGLVVPAAFLLPGTAASA